MKQAAFYLLVNREIEKSLFYCREQYWWIAWDILSWEANFICFLGIVALDLFSRDRMGLGYYYLCACGWRAEWGQQPVTVLISSTVITCPDPDCVLTLSESLLYCLFQTRSAMSVRLKQPAEFASRGYCLGLSAGVCVSDVKVTRMGAGSSEMTIVLGRSWWLGRVGDVAASLLHGPWALVPSSQSPRRSPGSSFAFPQSVFTTTWSNSSSLHLHLIFLLCHHLTGISLA